MTSTSSSITENNKEKESAAFKVYYRHKQSLIELKFTDNKMRVEEVITKCIEILTDTYMIKLNHNHTFYALYPAMKGG